MPHGTGQCEPLEHEHILYATRAEARRTFSTALSTPSIFVDQSDPTGRMNLFGWMGVEVLVMIASGGEESWMEESLAGASVYGLRYRVVELAQGRQSHARSRLVEPHWHVLAGIG